MTARLLTGDALALMRPMPDNAFDSIVTDAPYGMSAPPDIAEVLRHWLPEDPRIVSAIVDLLRIRAIARAEGFWPAIAEHTTAALLKLIAVVRQSRAAYKHGSTGFMGQKWDSFVPSPQVWTEALRVIKPGGHALVFASTRTVDLMGIACRLGGWEVRDTLHWLHYQGMPKGGSIGARVDALRDDVDEVRVVCRFLRAAMDSQGVKSPAIAAPFGVHSRMVDHWAARDTDSQPTLPKPDQWRRLKALLDFGDDMDDEVARLNARKGTWGNEREDRETGEPGANNVLQPTVAVANAGTPVTDGAAKWEGWHSHLKPAIEPILLLRKPLSESSIARNVLRWSTGALNIDACRIPQGSSIWPGPQEKAAQTHSRNVDSAVYGDFGTQETHTTAGQLIGRYPANLFHFSKPSRKEKEAGCEALPARLSTDVTGRAPGSPGHENPMSGDRRKGTIRNTHSTVKGVPLMRYLCRLVTPPGGDILDMFGGSGSTGMAAKLEGFDVTLCELDPAFVNIARARIKHAAPGQEVEGGEDPEPAKGQQVGLFG